jgi:hypothetical protein
MVRGGAGCGSFKLSSMAYSTSFWCWLEMVRDKTQSSRSDQNGPVIFTSLNLTEV